MKTLYLVRSFILASMLLVLSFGFNSFAQQTPEESVDKGEKLFLEGKYKESIPILSKHATNGDEKAQFLLGRAYEEGLGLEPNQRIAFSFYSAASKKNHAPAQTKLALYYLSGKFVLQDFKKSLELLSGAAKRKNAEAALILANLHKQGIVVGKNEKREYEYFFSAAELGSPVAQYEIGTYYSGEKIYPSIEKDSEVALNWFAKASASLFVPAILRVAGHYADSGESGRPQEIAHACFNIASALGAEKAKNEMRRLAEGMSLEEIYSAQDLARKILNDPTMFERLENARAKTESKNSER